MKKGQRSAATSKDMYVCIYLCERGCIRYAAGRREREERIARGLLGSRVAKKEKIRDPCAEEEEEKNRREAERGKRQRTATGNILKVDKAGRRERKKKPGEG